MTPRQPPREGPWQLDPQLADDTHPLGQLELGELRLMDDANHPWLILVPRVAGAIEWVDLGVGDQAALCRDITRASRLLQEQFRPHKLNVAALGNVVAQLHVHVIARFEGDIAWPRPVWGSATRLPYSPEQLVERIERLRAALQA